MLETHIWVEVEICKKKKMSKVFLNGSRDAHWQDKITEVCHTTIWIFFNIIVLYTSNGLDYIF